MESYVFQRKRPILSRLFSSPAPVAVCLHIFYADVAHEILDRLSKLTTDFTLFVTYFDRLEPLLSKRLGSLDRDVHFIPTENSGRDVLPFLRCLSHPAIGLFEFVVKLHTKGSSAQFGEVWKETCLDSVIGDARNFASILDHFRQDQSLMMAGPSLTYLSARQFMYGNKENLARIKDRLLGGYQLDEWGFFAGTMFWARRNLFEPLLTFEQVGIKFEPERGATDGALEHAFERVFGLLPSFRNGSIGLLGPKNTLEVISGVGVPSKVTISETMTRLVAR